MSLLRGIRPRTARSMVLTVICLAGLASSVRAQACIGVEARPGERAALVHAGSAGGGTWLGAEAVWSVREPLSLLGHADLVFRGDDRFRRIGGRLVVPEPYESVSLCFLGGLDAFWHVSREPDLFSTPGLNESRHHGVAPTVAAAVGRGLEAGAGRLVLHGSGEFQVPILLEEPATAEAGGVLELGATYRSGRLMFGGILAFRAGDSTSLVRRSTSGGWAMGRTVALRVGVSL